MTRPPTVTELRNAALVSEGSIPILTRKGREWLRVLEDLQREEVVADSEAAADLVLSTNGLFR